MGLVLKGLEEFRRFFDRGRRSQALKRSTRKELQLQLILLRRDIVRYIDTEKHGVPNSPLTILVKGSSRPLVDRGDLRSSINYRTYDSTGGVEGGVGVLRTRRTRDGRSLSNVAIALHEGFTVRVTPAVRAAVFAEMRRRGRKKRVKASGAGARTWKVRGRPFIRAPLEAAEPRIKAALAEAVHISFERG